MLASARNSRRSILPALASTASASMAAGIPLGSLLRFFIGYLHCRFVLLGISRVKGDDENGRGPSRQGLVRPYSRRRCAERREKHHAVQAVTNAPEAILAP